MDCEQIQELLDAYALGAAEAKEAAVLERHVADCVRCWSSLNEAQRVAAAIALPKAVERAPHALRDRVLAVTGRTQRRLSLRLPAGRGLWPVATGVAAAGAAAAIAFAVSLRVEVSDLRDDNDRLEAQVADAGTVLREQQQLMAVLAAPDAQLIALEPTQAGSPAAAVYYWSRTSRTGALLTNNLPALLAGQTYRVWVLTDEETYDVGSFESWNGIGQLSMDMRQVSERPVAIGVSIEDGESGGRPTEMLLFAEFPR